MTIRRGGVAWTAAGALALGLIVPQLSTTATGAMNSGSGSGSTREFGPGIPGDGAGSGGTTHRSKAVRGGRHTSPTAELAVDGAAPGRAQSFDGINFYQHRYVADGGNQFSLVPPDQALCAGGGQVVESVNNAIAVYSGGARQSLMSLNRFLFDDSEFTRPAGVASPHQVGDPSCIFDPGTGRFFLTVYDLTSDSGPNGG